MWLCSAYLMFFNSLFLNCITPYRSSVPSAIRCTSRAPLFRRRIVLEPIWNVQLYSSGISPNRDFFPRICRLEKSYSFSSFLRIVSRSVQLYTSHSTFATATFYYILCDIRLLHNYWLSHGYRPRAPDC